MTEFPRSLTPVYLAASPNYGVYEAPLNNDICPLEAHCGPGLKTVRWATRSAAFQYLGTAVHNHRTNLLEGSSLCTTGRFVCLFRCLLRGDRFMNSDEYLLISNFSSSI